MNNVKDLPPVIIECKVNLSRMGTINTLMENFNCQAYIESCWEDDKLFDSLLTKLDIDMSLLEIEDIFKYLSEHVKTFKYDSSKEWSPLIFIENAIGDLKEDITYNLEIIEKKPENEKNRKNVTFVETGVRYLKYTIKVHELRYFEGVFYEVCVCVFFFVFNFFFFFLNSVLN